MSITVIREGNLTRVVEVSEPMPEGVPMKFALIENDPVETAQIESVFAEDDEDWGDLLAPFRVEKSR